MPDLLSYRWFCQQEERRRQCGMLIRLSFIVPLLRLAKSWSRRSSTGCTGKGDSTVAVTISISAVAVRYAI